MSEKIISVIKCNQDNFNIFKTGSLFERGFIIYETATETATETAMETATETAMETATGMATETATETGTETAMETATACATKMYTKILPLVTDLHQSGNIDNFYKVYYMTFLLNAPFYITDDLHTPISTLILKKIGERLVERHRCT